MAAPRLRQPAIVPKAPEAAKPFAGDPSGIIRAHFQTVWQTGMHDMPFVNNSISVETVGFQRYAGDWLGVVITPWFINLFLVPGGGSLWADWPTGEQRGVVLPAGSMDFIADNPGADAVLPAYQYCPLIAPVQSVENQDAAREIATAALVAVMSPPPVSDAAEQDAIRLEQSPAQGAPDGAGTQGTEPSEAATVAPEVSQSVSASRRGFLRRLGGRKS